jgi:hypothetical protein
MKIDTEFVNDCGRLLQATGALDDEFDVGIVVGRVSYPHNDCLQATNISLLTHSTTYKTTHTQNSTVARSGATPPRDCCAGRVARRKECDRRALLN